jgi:hypothetical protein
VITILQLSWVGKEIPGSLDCFFCLVGFFFFWQFWDFNSGLHTCWTGESLILPVLFCAEYF